jgi:hypothetical protein
MGVENKYKLEFDDKWKDSWMGMEEKSNLHKIEKSISYRAGTPYGDLKNKSITLLKSFDDKVRFDGSFLEFGRKYSRERMTKMIDPLPGLNYFTPVPMPDMTDALMAAWNSVRTNVERTKVNLKFPLIIAHARALNAQRSTA